MARKKSKFSKALLAVVEFVGLALSVYLLLISLHVIYADEVPCPRSKWFECKSVVRGQFSHLGPFPIAGLGALYFVVQLILTAAMQKKGTTRLLKLAALFSGLVFIAALRAVEFVWLRKICPWCWGVALTVLVEAVVAWPGLIPPLPRFRWFGRIVSVLLIFLLFATSSIGVGFMIKEQQRESRRSKADPAETPQTAKPTPKATPRTTPKATPKATPKPTPAGTVRNTPVTATPTPEIKATPKPPPPAAFNLDAEPESELDTAETSILRARRWKIVARTTSVEKAVTHLPPVLLLTFDAYCDECHWLINNGLSQPELDDLPVTRVAIEQGSLEGWISDQVKNVPSLILFGMNGEILYKHEGRRTHKQVREAVEKALGLAP